MKLELPDDSKMYSFIISRRVLQENMDFLVEHVLLEACYRGGLVEQPQSSFRVKYRQVLCQLLSYVGTDFRKNMDFLGEACSVGNLWMVCHVL